MVKNQPANAGDVGDTSSIPGTGRSPGGGNGNPLPYSCLENPTDRGSWQATVQRVAESDTTERLSMHAHTHKYKGVAVRRQVGNCSLRQCNVTPNVTFGRTYPLSSL